MARRKATANRANEASPRKRRFCSNEATLVETPLKRSRQKKEQKETDEPYVLQPSDESDLEPAPSPSNRKARTVRSLNATSNPLHDESAENVRPSSVSRTRAAESPDVKAIDTPSRRNLADRSAKRKTTRVLIARVAGEEVSDNEDINHVIAGEIFDESAEEAEKMESEEDGSSDGENVEPKTPSMSARRKKKATASRKKSPTPPRNLSAHEQYFYQNKPGLAKTSNNTLSSLQLLTHDEYFTLLHKWQDPHASDKAFLESLHAESFPQWSFELEQGFSLCLYGFGSKRRLLHQFATHLYMKIPAEDQPRHHFAVVNGFVRTLTARDILNTLGAAMDYSHRFWSGNPATATANLLSLLSSSSSLHEKAVLVTLFIHSIDAPPLRKPGLQSLLARLTAHSQIRLVCTADTADFPLMWNSGQRASFSFAFHDCTTFAPRTAPELDVVDEVHQLLGRKAYRAGGKEGVIFVLRSLPENGQALFRLIVGEALATWEEDWGAGNADCHGGGGECPGVEYRMMYNKAAEEFICSSEMAFRTLLKEFHDHQIINSRKDAIGTELLSLPFRKEELEGILEAITT